MIKTLSFKQRGDTIIEVLLAMSIIGLVLGAAFGIANRSVNIGQEAQERTEALKIAETQLELFKSAFPSSTTLPARTEIEPFCFDPTASPVVEVDSSDALCQNNNGAGQAGLYSIVITPPALTDPSRAYTINVVWDRLGASSATGQNTTTLYYKPGSL